MSQHETNQPEDLEARFDRGDDVLDSFETSVILNIRRVAELAPILNLSAWAREAGVPVQTLQSKIRRQTPLSGDETRRLVAALRKYHLATVS